MHSNVCIAEASPQQKLETLDMTRLIDLSNTLLIGVPCTEAFSCYQQLLMACVQ